MSRSFDKERVKAALDVAELLGLKGGRASGLVKCPFHPDSDPSLSVDRRKQVWKCHGCGKAGDALDYFGYLRFGDGYDRSAHFPEALADAAGAAGVLPDSEGVQRRAPRGRPSPSLDAVFAARRLTEARNAERPDVRDRNDALQARYSADWNDRAAAYLASRGLDPGLARSLGAGFCPSWLGADRVTFPLTLPSGEIRKFYGRAIEPRPAGTKKAVNSSKEVLGIDDGEAIGGWFNAPALLEHWAVYIVEGVPDALALIQSGYPGTVATIGASLPAYDPQWLTGPRIGPLPRPVFLCQDNDAPGRKAALDAKADLEAKTMGLLRVEIAHPPDGFKDWAEALAAGVPIVLPKPEPPGRPVPAPVPETERLKPAAAPAPSPQTGVQGPILPRSGNPVELETSAFDVDAEGRLSPPRYSARLTPDGSRALLSQGGETWAVPLDYVLRTLRPAGDDDGTRFRPVPGAPHRWRAEFPDPRPPDGLPKDAEPLEGERLARLARDEFRELEAPPPETGRVSAYYRTARAFARAQDAALWLTPPSKLGKPIPPDAPKARTAPGNAPRRSVSPPTPDAPRSDPGGIPGHLRGRVQAWDARIAEAWAWREWMELPKAGRPPVRTVGEAVAFAMSRWG